MQVKVHDVYLNAVDAPEKIESIIWTNRYYTPGDFELYLPASTEAFETFKKDMYVSIDDEPELMIIESVSLETSEDEGDHVIVKGREASCILDRRIVWEQTNLNARLETAVYILLSKNIISPDNNSRRLFNLNYFPRNLNRAPFNETVSAHFTGDVLSEAVRSILEPRNLGYSIKANDQWNGLEFAIREGVDRTFNSNENFVVFSPIFENLTSSNYFLDTSEYKNVALVHGEGEGSDRKRTDVYFGSEPYGINRRELYVDARDIQNPNDGTMSSSEYISVLKARGIRDLQGAPLKLEFSGQSDYSLGYTFNKDYFVGDVVEVANEYGLAYPCRILEYTRSLSGSESRHYPTLSREGA